MAVSPQPWSFFGSFRPSKRTTDGALHLLLFVGLACGILLGVLVTPEAVAQQAWQILGLGSDVEMWPPPGMFLKPVWGALIPGPPPGNLGSAAAVEVDGAVVTAMLGSSRLSVTTLDDLQQLVPTSPGQRLTPRLRSSADEFKVEGLVSLPNGGLAAAGRGMISVPNITMLVWVDAQAVLQNEAIRMTLSIGQGPAQHRVSAFNSLPTGGIAAADMAVGSITVWPNASAIIQNIPPFILECSADYRKYPASIVAFPLPAAGIAVGTANFSSPSTAGTVEIWPTMDYITQNQGGGYAATVLPTSAGVISLIILQGGGIAAGTITSTVPLGGGTVEIWPNSSSLEIGGPAPITLKVPGGVVALLELDGGGLAVATDDRNSLVVWLTSQDWLDGQAPIELSASPVGALAALPGGGLVAGVRDTSKSSSIILVWPDSKSLARGGAAPAKLSVSSAASALLMLSGGALAAGTVTGEVDIWPDISLLKDTSGTDGEEGAFDLETNIEATTLLGLPGGGLAAAGKGTSIDVWPNKSSVQRGGAAPLILSIESDTAVVEALTLLSDGGIAAAGTDMRLVHLWPDAAAVERGGPATQFLPLEAGAYSLMALENGGLAVGLVNGKIDVWLDDYAIQSGVPNVTLTTTRATSKDGLRFVFALFALPEGGIAAGTADSVIDIWPNSSWVESERSPAMTLRATGPVRAIVAFGNGGLAAACALDEGQINVWPDAASVKSGKNAPIVLLSGPGTTIFGALLALPGGGIAAGTLAGTVIIWPDLDTILRGGLPTLELQAAAAVYSLVFIPGVGMAAASWIGIINLWPSNLQEEGEARSAAANSSLCPAAEARRLTRKPHRAPSLQASGYIFSVSPFGNNGLAVGTIGNNSGLIDLWPDTGDLPEYAPLTLSTLGLPLAMIQLPDGGLAAGTNQNIVQLWRAKNLQAGSPADATLVASGWVRALLILPDGGLALGCDSESNGTIDIWMGAEYWSGAPPTLKLAASGPVWALLSLPNGGLVAGTSELFLEGNALLGGVVDVWPTKDAVMQGARAPVRLFASGPVRSLQSLPGGGLVVGTSNFKVDFWLRSEAVQKGLAKSFELPTPAAVASSIAVMPAALIAGGGVFTPSPCPAGDYSPGGLIDQCRSCESNWQSVPGAADCRFVGLSTFRRILGGLALLTFALVCAVRLSLRLAKWSPSFERLSCFGEGWCEGSTVPKSCAALAILACGISLSMQLHAGAQLGYSIIADLAVTIAALISCALLLVPSNIASSCRLVAQGIVALCVVSVSLRVSAPSTQPALTPFGPMRTLAGVEMWLLLSGLVLLLVACCVQRALEIHSEQQNEGGQELPGPREHPAVVWSLTAGSLGTRSNGGAWGGGTWLGPTTGALGSLAPPLAEVQEESVELRSTAPPTIGPRASSFISMAVIEPVRMRCCLNRKQRWEWASAAATVASTWCSHHVMAMFGALMTLFNMSYQLSEAGEVSVRAGLLLCVILCSSLQLLVSLLAEVLVFCELPSRWRLLTKPLVDKHLRLTVVLKYTSHGIKMMLLNLPFTLVMDVNFFWRCDTPALCPSDCTERHKGVCATTTSNECVCQAWTSAKTLTLANCALNASILLGVALMSLPMYWVNTTMRIQLEWRRTKLISHLILAVAPPLIQLVYLALICFEQPKCLVWADVPLVVYPSLFLTLLANEAGRALRSWFPNTAGFSAVWSDNLIMTLRPFAGTLAALATALCYARARAVSPLWPPGTDYCGGTSWYWGVCSVLFGLSAVATAAMGPVAAPYQTPMIRTFEPGVRSHGPVHFEEPPGSSSDSLN